ncbi:hypothetical protein CAPTEDRAFT_151888 [Capitella teleta]|uniref:Leucine-rich repeat-containing protein 34 n=1 Tax=Capitella teleta TaxID=283909 RepID=R7VDP1_CAPTE|nr:hypothetical protein CAPTEDRAFT_151888 [Capitella teleta]|eukprot:ELU16968.1 hypothetical protein CAPTEDRAFT_151888 [Capitella teleta]
MLLYLAGNNKLITNVRLDDAQAEIIYKWLRNNIFVTALDLRYNNITDVGSKHIAKLLEETATLEELNLMNNDIGEEGAKDIAQALLKNETLKKLRMSGNKIGFKGGMCFAQTLQINTTLEELDLGDTDLTTDCVIALATVLRANSTLKSLNANRPILFSHQEETTVHFANMLKVNRSLKELHLMKYDMRDFGITRLSEKLVDNMTLTYLNLSCNRITRDGAKELSKLLRKDTALKVIDLSFNRLGDDGAIDIAEALMTFNTNLQTLVITSNEIRAKGLCALANALQMNSTLDNIYIWGNCLEEPACIAFAGLIDSGRIALKNTDVEPYVVDGTTYLSELNHGTRNFYYAGPSHGEQALPELAKFAQFVTPSRS